MNKKQNAGNAENGGMLCYRDALKHSGEFRQTFRGNVAEHSSECHQHIPVNVIKHSRECSSRFRGI